MAAHRDDPLGAELLGGQDPEQSDRSIADDGDGFAGAGVGGDSGEPARPEYVGGGQQAGHHLGRRHLAGGHERAVGERDARVLGLGADVAHQFALHAAALVARLTDLAGVVGRDERSNNELARLDIADAAADFFDDTDVFVTHGCVVDVVDAAVRPEIRTADARRRQPDDRVRRADDVGVVAVFDAHVAWSMHHHATHWLTFLRVIACFPPRP